MDPLVEILFEAATGGPLAEALLVALREDGQQPEGDLLRAWIAEGHVRVEDVVVRDPACFLAPGQEVELSAWPAPAEAMVEAPTVDVEEILHLDEFVLVAEYTPGSEPVADHLAALLARAGRHDVEPVLVPDHDPRASGLVAAGLKPRGAPDLDPGSRPCGVRVSVKALARGEPTGDLGDIEIARRLPGALLVRTPPIRSAGELRERLEARGLRVLEADGTVDSGGRPLLLHVAGLALTHPHTGHTQMWMCLQPPWFTAALKAFDGS